LTVKPVAEATGAENVGVNAVATPVIVADPSAYPVLEVLTVPV
jgi:hypothetical protein